MDWVRILAYITGTVDQELLLRNEYLVAENRILKAQLKTPLRLTDAERATLAGIAHRLGRKALEEVANVMEPDTIMGWYRKLVARKFDGSKSRRYPGRPRIDGEIEELVVRMARENSGWGYHRIVGAMANLGYTLSDQTVGNILQRHGIPPAPERKRATTWADFIRRRWRLLWVTTLQTDTGQLQVLKSGSWMALMTKRPFELSWRENGLCLGHDKRATSTAEWRLNRLNRGEYETSTAPTAIDHFTFTNTYTSFNFTFRQIGSGWAC